MTSTSELKTDLLLLLLYCKGQSGKNNEPITGITRFMKLLFLLKEEAGIDDAFYFEPYKMGPFSSDVYPEIEFLENFPTPDDPLLVGKETNEKDLPINPEHMRLLEDFSDSEDLTSSEINKEFRLSRKGEDVAAKLWEDLSPEQKNKFESIKQKYGSLSLKELLRYVYDRYPDMTTKSEIKNQL